MSRILVLDDQEHIRNIIKKFLVMDRHEVDVAADGSEGMKLAAGASYDLVITDIVMPEKDGYEVLRELKQLSPGVKIIVMSGGAVKLDVDNLLVTAKFMGADVAIAKPLDFTLLQTAVNKLLAVAG